MSYEHDRAIMEGHMHTACDEYFNVRPQIDTNFARRVFEAGFARAWHAVQAGPGPCPSRIAGDEQP